MNFHRDAFDSAQPRGVAEQREFRTFDIALEQVHLTREHMLYRQDGRHSAFGVIPYEILGPDQAKPDRFRFDLVQGEQCVAFADEAALSLYRAHMAPELRGQHSEDAAIRSEVHDIPSGTRNEGIIREVAAAPIYLANQTHRFARDDQIDAEYADAKEAAVPAETIIDTVQAPRAYNRGEATGGYPNVASRFQRPGERKQVMEFVQCAHGAVIEQVRA